MKIDDLSGCEFENPFIPYEPRSNDVDFYIWDDSNGPGTFSHFPNSNVGDPTLFESHRLGQSTHTFCASFRREDKLVAETVEILGIQLL